MNRRILRLFVGLSLALLLFPAAAQAMEPGAYTGSAVTSYVNPDTGKIDDGGTENAALGEGMCRSATDPACLLEVEADGAMWLTVRLLLQSECSQVSFYTREGADSYVPVDYDITAENSLTDSADYRFRVPSLPAQLKAQMYVIPMGRAVVWYITCDGFTPGSGDFAVSSEMLPQEEPAAASEEEVMPPVEENPENPLAENLLEETSTPAETPEITIMEEKPEPEENVEPEAEPETVKAEEEPTAQEIQEENVPPAAEPQAEVQTEATVNEAQQETADPGVSNEKPHKRWGFLLAGAAAAAAGVFYGLRRTGKRTGSDS